MKKGFTLIELLCVILLIGILTTMAVSGVLKMTKSSKENLYCAKIKIIESAALDYSKKVSKELKDSNTYYGDYKSLTITINDLILNNNLTPDQDNILINPLDNSSMNDLPIIIYLKDNQVKTFMDTNNICAN